MTTSQHAKTRQQQRVIPEVLIDLLYQFGAEQYQHPRNSIVRYFDKAARRKIKAHVGKQLYAVLEKQLDAYAVFASDTNTIITMGHRYKPIHH